MPGRPSVWPDRDLIEFHPKLNANAMNRVGALVAGARTVWRWPQGQKATVRATHGQIFLIGDRVQVIRFGLIPLTLLYGGERVRFFCPSCGRGCYYLHDKAGVFACRKCCGYDWRCRHRNRYDPFGRKLMADIITDLVADDLDPEILKHRMAGISVRAIMRRYALTKREVDAALDRALPQIDNATRIAAIKLELERLDQLIRPFFVKALAGDTAAASILVKLSERRSSLLGLDAPLRIDATLVESYENPNSTQDLEAAINRLIGKPAQSH